MLRKRKYKLAIQRMIRIAIVGCALWMAAAIVFVRHITIGWGMSPGQYLLLTTYALILLGYASFLAKMYEYCRTWGEEDGKKWWLALYLISGGLTVIFINTAFLQVLVQESVPNILKYPPYWYKEFPFFFAILLVYIVAIHWFPQTRILWRIKRNDSDKEKSVLWEVWTTTGDTAALLALLRLEYGKNDRPDIAGSRLMDIIALIYENGSYFVILSNGEKLLTHLSSKDLETWPTANWFVQIRRACYVNMLHVECGTSKDAIKMNRTSIESLHPTVQERIESMATISRKCRKYVEAFYADYKSFSLSGWDTPVRLHAQGALEPGAESPVGISFS